MTLVVRSSPVGLAPGGMCSMCWHGYFLNGVAASSLDHAVTDDS